MFFESRIAIPFEKYWNVPPLGPPVNFKYSLAEANGVMLIRNRKIINVNMEYCLILCP